MGMPGGADAEAVAFFPKKGGAAVEDGRSKPLAWLIGDGMRLACRCPMPIQGVGEVLRGFGTVAGEVVDAARRDGEVGGTGSSGRDGFVGFSVNVGECPTGDRKGFAGEGRDEGGGDEGGVSYLLAPLLAALPGLARRAGT